jgi:hypothetical protein
MEMLSVISFLESNWNTNQNLKYTFLKTKVPFSITVTKYFRSPTLKKLRFIWLMVSHIAFGFVVS